MGRGGLGDTGNIQAETLKVSLPEVLFSIPLRLSHPYICVIWVSLKSCITISKFMFILQEVDEGRDFLQEK